MQNAAKQPLQAWQQALADAYTRPQDLLDFLGLPHTLLSSPSNETTKKFPFLVPRSYAVRINKADPLDPLLLQVLPSSEEIQPTPGYSDDPLQEQQAIKSRGILHKYQGRLLLIVSSGCAIHCRYCFRREFPYAEAQLTQSQEETALNYIRNDPRITEVILSGGDPLLLSDSRLNRLITKLDDIPHLKRLRIHSRIPVILPSRIQPSLLRCLQQSRLIPVIVLHSNHPAEINQEVRTALDQIKAFGITLLNQAVLLKNINDNAEILTELSEVLFEAGVLPYYLHLLDKTTGTAHFDVTESKALILMEHIRTTLPGYLVPKLVRETANAAYKSPIA